MTKDGRRRTEDSGRKAKPDPFHLSPGVSRGFTLLEILLAIFILTLVVSAVFGAFNGTFRVVTDTETQEETYAAARVALEQICEDLASVYGVSKGKKAEANATSEQPVFVGEDHETNDQSADTLRFTSHAHISFKSGHQEGGAAQIRYYTQTDEKSGDLSLYRSDTLNYLESPEAGGLLLCDGLKWLDFIYYDKNGEPHKTWEDKESDGNGALPSRVEISIGFKNDLDPEKPLQFTTGVALPPMM